MNSFNKREKLKSKKLIEQLFAKGKSVSSYPIKLIYLKSEHSSENLLQVAVSVPKRKVKKAVDRNRIKRLLRECYRLNKDEVCKTLQEKYIFMFLYLDEKEHPYVLLEDKMIKLLRKFIEKEQL